MSDIWADRLLSALREAYDRVIDAALSRKVDFVVIAGDVFDSTRSSYGDYLHFFDGLRELEKAHIPVYLVTGNHDPYVSWEQGLFALPGNATMFPADKPGFALFEKDGEPLCLIGGRGYYNQAFPADECIAEGVTRAAAEAALSVENPRAAAAPFAVGVLHTGLTLDPYKAPVDPSVLMAAGMDYWACGHIHMRYAYPSMKDPRIVFPGCIQGRDIKETGPRGVLQVTLREGMRPQLDSIPTASVVWQRPKIDVSDCDTLPSVGDKIMRELFRENGEAHCEEMVSRITLVGVTPLHDVLARPDVLEELRKRTNDAYSAFFCDAMIDETRAPRDEAALRKEGLFPSVFLQVADKQQADAPGEVAFLQDEYLARSLSLPADCVKDAPSLAASAQDLVLDLLSKEEAAL